MVTPITRDVGWGRSKYYGSWKDLEAQNLNLVGLDQSMTVNLAGGIQPMGAGTLDGWTTDATRFLMFQGPALPSMDVLNCEDLTDRAVFFSSAAPAMVQNNVGGAGGFVIWKNCIFVGVNSTASAFSLTGAGVTRFINCIFLGLYQIGGNSPALYVSNAAAFVQCINCLFVHKLSGGGWGVQLSSCGSANFYHCTAIAKGAGFNLGGQVATLKNCYAVGGYINTGLAALTKCAATDATGSEVALQNIAYTPVNWNSASAGFQNDPEPINPNICVNGGADLSGEAPPYNVSDDVLGRARITATPSIGCREYLAQNPRVRHLWVGGGSSDQFFNDYATMTALGLANLDCQTRQERIYVELPALDTDTSGTTAVFDGWVTTPTYRLTIRTRRTGFFKQILKSTSMTVNTSGYFGWSKATAGHMVQVGNIGANGWLEFDNVQMHMTGATGSIFANHANGIGGTVVINRCKLSTGAAAAQVILSAAGGGNRFYVVSSRLMGYGLTATPIVDWAANVLSMHHCTVVSATAIGGTKAVIDMHDTAGCSLKNNYAYIQQWVATSYCYRNLAGVTFLKNASSDTTGSVGLQNVAYDSSNFLETSASYFLPCSTGALINAGADLSAETAPLNCVDDCMMISRYASTPTIGAREVPVLFHPDFFGGWTVQSTGFDFATTQRVDSICEFSVDGKLYATTAPKGSNPGKIYSSSDDGATWNLEYTAAVNENMWGGVEWNGRLWFVLYDLARIINYNPVGGVWSSGTDSLNGAAGAPVNCVGLFVSGSNLYAIIQASGKTGLYSSPDGATWTALASYPTWITNQQTSSAFVSAAGDIVAGGVNFLAWRPTGESYWSVFGLGAFMSPAFTTGGFHFDSTNNKLYFLGTNLAINWGGSNSWTWAGVLDLTTGKVTLTTPQEIVTTRSSYSIFKVKNDLWWGSASQAGPTPTGLFLAVGGSISSDPQVVDGYNTSLRLDASPNISPYPTSATSNQTVMHSGRLFIAAGYGTLNQACVIRSSLLLNASKFDNVTIQQAEWNMARFVASVLLKALAPNDAGYVSLDAVSRDSSSTLSRYYVRKASSYYLGGASLWRQYSARLDLRDGTEAMRETGVHLFASLFKEGQEVLIDGLQLTKGNGIPTSFAHPLEPRVAESFTFPNVADLNAFRIDLTWVPICAFDEVESTAYELVRFQYDATNYIRVVLMPSTAQREYVTDQVHGAHEPVIRLEKILAGVSVATVDLSCYWGFDLVDSGEGPIEEPVTISVAHTAGEALALRLTRAGDSASNWVTAGGAFAAQAVGSLILNGPGYFAPPEVVKDFATEGGRSLPVGRDGIGPRIAGVAVGQVLAGERDPLAGDVTANDPFALPGDAFDRADSPDIGTTWIHYLRTGAGFTILSNAADCAQEGWELWTRRPRNDYLTVQAKVVVSNNSCVAGLIGRMDENLSTAYCYGAELIQTGATAATVRLVVWTAGGRTILASQALSSYVAGATVLLQLVLDGSGLTAYARDPVAGTILGTATATNTTYVRPMRMGMYAQTGGAGEHVTFNDFTLIPNFERTLV